MGNSIVAARMKARRESLGLTLDDIAAEIGVSKSTIQRYETGTIERLKLPVIEAIANVMSVDPAWLIGKSDDCTVRPSASSDPALSPDEIQLVEDYRLLNKEGREYIRQTMAMAKRSYVRASDPVSDLEAAN